MRRRPAFDIEGLLDPSVIRLLLTIAGTGGFSAAADALGVSQPSVSQQVRRVEGLIGRTLFRRTRRGIQLTEDGEAVVIYARAMLGLTGDLRRRLDEAPADLQLSAGMSEDFCRIALPSVLRLFLLDHPRVRLRVVSGTYDTLSEAIENRAVDFAIMRRYDRFPQAETLYRDTQVWIGGPDLKPPIADPVPLVLPLPPSPGRNVVIDCLREAGRDFVVRFESVGIAGMEMALGANLGVCAAPPGMTFLNAAPLPDGHGLPALPPVEFIVVRNQTANSDLAEALTALLAAAAKDRFRSHQEARARVAGIADPSPRARPIG